MSEGMAMGEDSCHSSVVMATYNGERFLLEQLESLMVQEVLPDEIVVADDCSTDGSFEIVREFASAHQEIKWAVYRNDRNLGWKRNFKGAIARAHGEYVFLCDQDDVWLPNKIEITLKKMKSMERRFGKEKPALVHTDLVVVDEKLNVISKSFKKMMNADYGKIRINNEIVQNTLTGCTVMYNKALAEYIKNTPKYMVMHDWWLMLIASAFGNIGIVNYQTVLYRQHGKNVVGTRNMRSYKFMLLMFLEKGNYIRNALKESYIQAGSFYCMYGKMLNCESKNVVFMYSRMISMCKFKKIITLFKLNTFKNGLFRKIAQIIYA